MVSLQQWYLSGFKSIGRPTTLTLAPLTVISGMNSSGKSSVLQSIRLVVQTLRNQSNERPLVLNGYELQLGNFSSLCNNRASRKSIDIGFLIEVDERSQIAEPVGPYSDDQEISNSPLLVRCKVTFADDLNAKRRLNNPEVLLTDGVFQVFSTEPLQRFLVEEMDDEFGDPDVPIHQANLSISFLSRESSKVVLERTDTEFRGRAIFEYLRNYVVRFEEEDKRNENKRIYLTWLSHFLPSTFFSSFDVVERRRAELFWRLKLEMIAPSNTSEFTSLPMSFERIPLPLEVKLPESLLKAIVDSANLSTDLKPKNETLGEVLRWLDEIRGKKNLAGVSKEWLDGSLQLIVEYLVPGVSDHPERSSSDNPIGFEPVQGDPVTTAIAFSSKRVIDYFVNRVRYLGPIRLEPLVAPSFSPSGELDDVGPKGEFAASVFDANTFRTISWWNPATSALEESLLPEAINFWLKFIGIASSARVLQSQSGYTWRVTPLNDTHSRPLSAIGVGISQVLPILVAGLLAESGSLLLVEQPELHLHPRAQARLADFFVSLALTKRQCIVETHSESFLNQLRLTIASQNSESSPITQIYFATTDEKGDSDFASIDITNDGVILNWPDGFFDENLILEDKITELAIRRRARSR